MEKIDDLYRITIDLDPPKFKEINLSTTCHKLYLLVQDEYAAVEIIAKPNVKEYGRYSRYYKLTAGINILCLCRHLKYEPTYTRQNKILLRIAPPNNNIPLPPVRYTEEAYQQTWMYKDIFNKNDPILFIAISMTPNKSIPPLAWLTTKYIGLQSIPFQSLTTSMYGRLPMEVIKKLTLNSLQTALLHLQPNGIICTDFLTFRGHRYPFSSTDEKIPFSAERLCHIINTNITFAFILSSKNGPTLTAETVYQDEDSRNSVSSLDESNMDSDSNSEND